MKLRSTLALALALVAGAAQAQEVYVSPNGGSPGCSGPGCAGGNAGGGGPSPFRERAFMIVFRIGARPVRFCMAQQQQSHLRLPQESEIE